MSEFDPAHRTPPGVQAFLVDPAVLGSLDATDLAAALRPLFERAEPLVARLVGRTFSSWSAVLDAAAEAVQAMDEAELATLLNSHPRVGEAPATLAERSPESFVEQGAGVDEDAPVGARLAELNDAYERRFGFCFVEWVAGRPKASIVVALEARLERDRATELCAGGAALIAIARDRLGRYPSQQG